MAREDLREGIRGARLIDANGLALEFLEVAGELVRRANVGKGLDRVPHGVVELGAVHIERGPAVLWNYRECKRERRMGDIGAANVESPGDVLRVGDQQRVGAQLRNLGADPFELVRRGLARELGVAQADRAGRRGRTILPQRIDGIAVDGDELCAGGGAGLLQTFGLLAGVQPRIVSELRIAFKVVGDPLIGRTLHQVLDREYFSVDLGVGLQRVAAIDEHSGAIAQHDRRARRAGEAGEPRQALLARRQVLVLLPIGARDDESIEAEPLQLGAQGRDARCTLGARARILEGLEAGFKHGMSAL